MSLDQLYDSPVRRAARIEFPVLEVDEFRKKELLLGNALDPVSKLGHVRLRYILPTIGAGKGEVYLDEADCITVVA